LSLLIRGLLRTLGRTARALKRRAGVLVAGSGLGLLLVVQSAVGPLAPVAYADVGTMTAEMVFGASLPSLEDLGVACEVATGGMCLPALALGAALVVAGWTFANPSQAYSGIQAAWNGLSGSDAEELKQNLEANNGSLVNPSSQLVYDISSSVADIQATGGWTSYTLTGTNAYTGPYLTYSLPANSALSDFLTWTFSAPETASAGAWWLGDESKNGANAFLGAAALAGSTIDGILPSGVQESWTIQDITSSNSWTGTVGAGTTDNSWASGAAPSFGVTNGDQLALSVSVSNSTSSAVTLGLYAGSSVGVIPEFVGAGGIDHVGMPPITASGGTVAIQGYTVPGTFSPGVTTPSTINVPSTIDDLVNANPGTTVTTDTGTQATLGSNVGTGQTGLLGGILGGIEALPSDIANEFLPTASESGVLSGELSAAGTTLGALEPFAAVGSFTSTVNSYFTNVGSTCPDPSWSFTLPGWSTWSYAVSLCDQLGVMSTVRNISAWVIYGVMIMFLFTEVRRWFQYGHM